MDVTRLARRAGRVLTGVDRVELNYLRALLQDTVPLFGLIRSRYGYLLLDQAGLSELVGPLAGERCVDIWALTRKLCRARVLPPFLGWMLRRHLPRGTAYINVGHSNLTARVLRSVKSAIGARIAVLIHDVIPLDFPHYQRAGVAETFAAMLARVEASADLVIYNSADTQARAEAHMRSPPASIVAHLGTDLVPPDPAALPAALPAPYLVCVGTIEPRKNHAFLLDLWDEMGADAPHLIIAGNRGWNNEAVLSRLDALPPEGPIRVLSGLTDGAIAALIAGSSGLLFPSHAEGFGLPAVEAAALGVPVIANDLPVFHEVLGNIPIYAAVSDRYLWINKIEVLVGRGLSGGPKAQFAPPSWDAHFKAVLRLT